MFETMSLRAAIHNHWKNDYQLNQAIPHQRFFTGNAPNPDDTPTPYAYMTDTSEPNYDSSDVIIDEHAVTIGVVGLDGDQVKKIGEIIQHRFSDKTLLQMTGSDELLEIWEGTNNLDEPEPGIVVFTQDYRMMVARHDTRVTT